MSFRDCIIGQIGKGAVDKKRGEDLLKKYDAALERFKRAGTDSTTAAAAAERLIEQERLLTLQKQRNLMKHTMKQREMNTKLNAGKGKIEKRVSNEIYLAADRVETVKNWAMSLMHEVAEKLSVNYAGLSRDYAGFEKGLRVLLGETSTDPEAKKLGEVMKSVFDGLHERFKQAGGIVGKLDNYFPQSHSKAAMLRVSKEEWRGFITPLLDMAKIIDEDTGLPFSPKKFSGVLDTIYDDIATAGRSKMEKLSQKGESVMSRGGDLDMQSSQERFLHFKDADSFLQYNGKFGVGDQGLIGAFGNHVNTMSRRIATLEKFGPRPNAMMRFMDFKMGAEGESFMGRRMAQAEYRVLTSQFQHGDIDSVWWKGLTGVQNWLRGALLGGGVLSALPDTSMMAATAKVNGLDAIRSLGNYLKIFAPGDNSLKQLAKRSGYIAEVLSGSAVGDTRFAGEAMGKGLPRVFANAMNELSGLQRTTKSTMDGIALEASATLAEHIHAKTPWEDVHADLRRNLEHYGFNEKDWADLHRAETVDNGSAKFLITSDLRVDENYTPARAKELADKIDDWINNMRRNAATEPTITTRAITSGAFLGGLNSGAGGQATPERAIMSTLGLFKSFPITVVMTHLLPAIQRARVSRNFDQLATVVIGTTVMGAVAQQLKDISKGKTAADMGNYKFWTRAILQGGGLGLYGDFLFGDYSRFGHSPLTELGGPVIGLVEDVLSATRGNLDKEIDGGNVNLGRDLFRVAKRNIPLGSLWYARLAIERGLLDNLERLVDPEYDQRIGKYERRMKKETGQQFWWRPGESRPQ